MFKWIKCLIVFIILLVVVVYFVLVFGMNLCWVCLGWFGFWSMMIFLAVLTIGFIYEWKKGALEWDWSRLSTSPPTCKRNRCPCKTILQPSLHQHPRVFSIPTPENQSGRTARFLVRSTTSWLIRGLSLPQPTISSIGPVQVRWCGWHLVWPAALLR